MAKTSYRKEKARLEELYTTKLRSELQTKLGIKNIQAVPKLDKIVINIGVKEAVSDSRAVQHAAQVLSRIAGQMPIRRQARKSIAGFKIREGMSIGVMVTLRKRKMYEFFDKLINLALPKVRDFQGVSTQFDRQGNYNLGIKEWTIFPEADMTITEKVQGLNVTICTTAYTDAHGLELLKGFGMPFVKENKEK